MAVGQTGACPSTTGTVPTRPAALGVGLLAGPVPRRPPLPGARWGWSRFCGPERTAVLLLHPGRPPRLAGPGTRGRHGGNSPRPCQVAEKAGVAHRVPGPVTVDV